MASVSSGPVAGHRGLPLGDLRRILGLCGHLDVDDLTGAGRALGLDRTRAHGDHRGVAGNLGLDGERATEDGVHADRALLDLDDVDQQTRSEPGGQPSGDLLAVGGGGQQHTRGRCGLDERRQHIDVGRDQVALGVV